MRCKTSCDVVLANGGFNRGTTRLSTSSRRSLVLGMGEGMGVE